MKIQDSILEKVIDFLIDIKFNTGVFFVGATILGQDGYLTTIKGWIQEYVFADFTFGQFFFIMLICKALIKIIRDIKKGEKINFRKEGYDFFLELAVYGCVFVGVHGMANFTVDGVKTEEFNYMPKIILGGCMVLEFKNVLKAAGLDLSKIIDDFTDFAKKLKPKKDE